MVAKIISQLLLAIFIFSSTYSQQRFDKSINQVRQKILINNGWRFYKYESLDCADSLIYDVRPDIKNYDDNKPADEIPTEAQIVNVNKMVLKPWILPTGNEFIKDTSKHYKKPAGNPGGDFPFLLKNYDDRSWEEVNLPHDWAIKGPFLEGKDAEVGGGMGRLPSHGIAWYRKKIFIPEEDKEKRIFLEVDGAMSYAMVWVNGHLAGGWPYGYASWYLDITPYINYGDENIIAIRLDNPPNSSRWYPGGGIYRNVWLSKTNPIHVNNWGTYITTSNVSLSSAIVHLKVVIKNDSDNNVTVSTVTKIFALNEKGEKVGKAVACSKPVKLEITEGKTAEISDSVLIKNPKLWGPPPAQKPNLYVAVTELYVDSKLVDYYETKFGIRSIEFNPDKGIFINGKKVKINGVNLHHDLGALGAAFNMRAAERQLEVLREMGCNAIRFAHNPPAPEFLELTDKMGFVVINEIFDVWERKKTPLDFHLIFPEWHEQDLRAFIRRDRNHPSVIIWSVGNEVGEQYTDEQGASIARKLRNIAKEEDPTRPVTAAMNYAKPDMPFSKVWDVISLNYQGEGIRNAPAYLHLKGIKTEPLYLAFHKKFSDKVILSSENAAALSSRGTYLFPVYSGISAPVSDSLGGDSNKRYVSAYELHTADFGSSADKVFATLDQHPFVAGGFVWSGWDYLGEPTPYYESRSSYFGIIDLAGFKKDRFYLYQSYWRPELPMAHILPHWNWPDRIGKITPVHVFTSGDEAELFLNGKSLGKKKKGQYEYRLRWDDVKYEPGELKVIAYKNGKVWAKDIVRTSLEPAQLNLEADRKIIKANGEDLSFITLKVLDKNGIIVPTASNEIKFEIEGPGEIVATDNGDPTDMTPFPLHVRRAFNGYALAIVRSKYNEDGKIKITAKAEGLKEAKIIIESKLMNQR
ncbi:MAG: beta-galactosidase GalB [Melioribacter sp.]|uniref:beta-galactosidase GalB n=1 Tax=Rosettibacter primus TaxID=3111523 RepID=UPI00247B7DD8|nr:beta-galactosidase GalB [Melioribacter sp.]